MNGVQKAVFPGVMLGIFALITVTRWIASPIQVLASTEEAQAAQVAVVEEAPINEETVVEAPKQAEEQEKPAESDDGDCAVSGSFAESIRQWCGLITRYAREAGLEPNLVAALIVQESGGNAQAYSHSGAVGLMQVMPRDGLAASFMCVNGPCFANRPSMAELYDPEFNISYGTRMLAGLVNKRGSLRDGLMAYGPMNVGYYYADKVLGIYEAHR